MTDKDKNSEFVVNDRRRRWSEEDGAIDETPIQQTASPTAAPPSATSVPPAEHAQAAQEQAPVGPSAEERERSHAEYKQSTADLESQLRKQYGSQLTADHFTVRFEDILEPFYVTALMQLGGGQEGPQRRVDPVGARRTIDTLELLRDKLKGNITQQEQDLLDAMLYQLRMAYMDVINALTRAPQGGGPAL